MESIVHLNNLLDKVLDITKKMGLKINPKKFVFAVSTLTFTGRKISANGI